MTRGFPHRQPFCVTPRRNLTKRNAWWQVEHKQKQGRRMNTQMHSLREQPQILKNYRDFAANDEREAKPAR